MLTDWMGVLVVLVMFTTLIVVVECLTRLTALAPEWSRKLVHLGGGVGCLLFPLLLTHALTVLLLAIVFGGGLWLAERKRWLQCLCRVQRTSHGSLYYPFAIAILFHMTRGAYGLYVSTVLVLTVADTAAALVGSQYGRIRYRIGGIDERKSLEGSLAFWILTFLVVVVPLSIWRIGECTYGQIALSAFLAATLLTLVEAVSLGGRDNLYVPLLAAFLLLKTVTKSVPELLMQSISIVLLFGLMPIANHYSHMLRTKTLMIMGIILYGVWSLGSVDWAVPMLLALLFFLAVFIRTGCDVRRTRVHRRLVWFTVPAAALMVAANLTGLYAFLYAPYLVALVVPLIVAVVRQFMPNPIASQPAGGWRALVGGGLAVVVVFAEPLAMRRFPDAHTVLLIVAVIILMLLISYGMMLAMRSIPAVVMTYGALLITILVVVAGQHVRLLGLWRPLLWADVYGRDVDVLFPVRTVDDSGRP